MKNIFNVVLTILASTILSVAQLPTNGLVAYYPFSGNANDESGNGNNGVVRNAFLTTDRFNQPNSAYQFVGNDNNTVSYIVSNHNNLPSGNSPRTISVWATNDSYGTIGGSGNDGHPIIAYGTPSTNSANEIMFFTNNFSVDYIRYGGFNNDLDIAFSYNLQSWYHIVATFDGLNSKIYINDSLLASGNFFTWNTILDSLLIGTQTSKSRFHNGKIDDIRIYNRALSQSEISTLYNEGGYPCLLASYPFNGNANDESGNGNDGDTTNHAPTLTTDRFGNANSAYSFDGVNDYIEILDNPTMEPGNNFSISAWFLSNVVPSHSLYVNSIISKESGYNQSGVGIHFNDYQNGAFLFLNGGYNYSFSGNKYIGLGKWTNAIITYDGSVAKLYINGQLDSQMPFVVSFDDLDFSWFIGKEFTGPSGWTNRYWNGKLDDIQIFNCAIDSATVSSIYHADGWALCNDTSITQNISIYDYESYTVGLNTYTISGTYADTIQTNLGCDSIIITNLSVKIQNKCDWLYNKQIAVNNQNNSEDLTDYTVLVYVNTAELIASGKMKADGSDIRFILDDNTMLNYWIDPGIQNEYGMNDDSTHIWVKIPQISGNSSITINMLYGNQTASAQSNISTAFIFGDDFNDGTLDLTKWDAIIEGQGQLIEQNGRIEHNSPKTTPESQAHLYSKQSFTGPVVVEMQFKKGGYVYRGVGLRDSYSNQNSAYVYWMDYGDMLTAQNVDGTNYSNVFKQDIWSRTVNPEYYVKVIRKADGTFYFSEKVPYFEQDGAKFWEQNMTNVIPLNTPLKVFAHESIWVSSPTSWIRYEDNIRVRKYSEPEPYTSIGTEQINNYSVTNTHMLCEGQAYYIGTTSYTNDTIIVQSSQTTIGCDSIITTQLIFVPNGETVTDTINKIIHDGRDCQDYPIEKIGNQWWMRKNLNAAKYQDGTNIPNELNSTIWTSLSTGALSYYNNDSAQYAETYGALYNWFAVADSRKVCPTGWQMPTDLEWHDLVLSADPSAVLADPESNTAGGTLKSTYYWNSPNTGATDAFNFNALPGGYRNFGTGGSSNLTWFGYYWTATEDVANADLRILSYDNTIVNRSAFSKTTGASVRCIKSNIEPLVVSLPENKALCNNEAAIVSTTVTGGVSPYTYIWSNETYMSWCGLSSPGYYYVTVTDANNVSVIDSILAYSVNINNVGENLLNLSVDYDTVCTGSGVNVSILNSQSGINYQLIIDGANYGNEYTGNGGTIGFASDILNSDAQLQVIARNPGSDCELILDTIINIHVANDYYLNLNLTATNVSCFGNANGSASVVATGGSGSYIYSWSTGGNGTSVQGLSPGSYFVAVQNSVACATYSYFNITQPNQLNVTYTVYPVTTGNNGIIDLSVSGGTPPYHYNWSNGMTTQDLMGLHGGIYNVTVTDAKGCTSSKSIVVSTQGCSLIVSAIATDATCYNSNTGFINITLTSGVAPYQFLWSNGSTSQNPTGLYADTYNVTVTDANGCVSTSTAVVNQPDEINLIKLITDANCSSTDGSATIIASGGTSPYQYLWNIGNTTSSLSSVFAGTYNVTVTDINNCKKIETVLINNFNSPVVTFDNISSPVCFNSNDGHVSITVSDGVTPYTIDWSSGGNTSTETGLTAGTVFVTVTDASNCSVIEQAELIAPDSILLNAEIHDVLYGNDGSIVVDVYGGTNPLSYNWSNSETTKNIYSLSAGDYTITVTDANSCSISETYTVSGLPCALNISSNTYDAACYNQSNGFIDITISNGQQPYTFKWSNGKTTEDLYNIHSGTYTVTATDNRGCAITSSIIVSEPPQISIAFSVNNASCGFSDGSIDAVVIGGVEPYSYQWSTGETTVGIQNLTAGSYTLILKDANQCTQFAVAYINNSSTLAFSPQISSNVSCYGGNDGTINILVSGGSTPYAYNWSNGATTEDITGLSAGFYEITITDNIGCMVTGNIEVTQPDQISVNVASTSANCGNSDGSAAAIVTGGTAPYSYLWTTFETTSSIAGISAGSYSVKVTDNNGCFKISSVAISNDNGPMISGSNITDATCNGSDGVIDITISGGSMPFTYLWNDNSVNEDLTLVPSDLYSVTITDDNGCVTIGNFMVEPQLPLINPICIVLVDSVTNRNKIIWDKVQSVGIDHYNLYRESTMAGVYQFLASIPYNNLSEFVDVNANPNIRSWRYKLSSVDQCGNESPLSDFHKTMHLTMNEGLGQTINLIWDHYEGFPFYSYEIYRHTSADGWVQIQVMPNNLTSFTDSPPTQEQLYYKITVDKGDSCWATSVDKSQTGPYSQSISNIDDYAIWTGIKEVSEVTEFIIYPNPAKNQLTVEIPSSKFQNPASKIEVLDIFGQVVFVTEIDKRQSIDTSNLPSGIYLIRLNSSNKTYIKKFIKE